MVDRLALTCARPRADENRARPPSTFAMDEGTPWCRLTLLGPDGEDLGSWVLDGDGSPDISTVDTLARLVVLIRRSGAAAEITEISPRLAELIALAGLNDLKSY